MLPRWQEPGPGPPRPPRLLPLQAGPTETLRGGAERGAVEGGGGRPRHLPAQPEDGQPHSSQPGPAGGARVKADQPQSGVRRPH